MRRIRILSALAILAVVACSSQPVYRHASAPLTTASVDLGRYGGFWYEQARLPNSFERHCRTATAEYSARADGLITVLNTCHEESGQSRTALGRARPVGGATSGKLQVSFFGPFWADYWVVERADDYTWSLVSEPRGRYLWLLTRAESISPQQRADFEARMRRLGFDPNDLEWAPGAAN